ncbi:MAG TPA: type I-C CRISPR-associated protein Cas7/Csd2, partial [Dehalococcoidia bacterium]|nr:type I-C CRISPR-associated protein Cas7/Csd2 [Dehalococcoidia bacterium]
FVLLFDVTDGNPNGDPDAGNLPHLDPETMQGLVTDVCLKRKVRNWIHMTQGGSNGVDIFVKDRGILANEQRRAFEGVKAGPSLGPNVEARKKMCEWFYDIRLFGAVMTTGKSGQRRSGKELHWNAGQVRGPVQLTFARSINPIIPLDISITRCARTNPDDPDPEEGANDEQARYGTMGRKAIVPYGLYRAHGFFSPYFAHDTGVTDSDLALFWEALQNMWDMDHSASRSSMACRGLYIFSHLNARGNTPAHRLFERVKVECKDGVEAPRSFSNYTVAVDDSDLPAGVTLTRLAE